jgi:triacylglycerol lipase
MSLVFAAGFLVPQHLAGKDYFRGVAAAFPGALFPSVPSVGDVPTRAHALAQQINAAFPQGPIHIVAHSMAGLDSRFLLSKNLFGLANAGRVASLSTISTPHWGSPIADLLVGPQPSLLDPRRLAYDTLIHFAAELGQPVGALGDLTSSYTATFNPQNPNVPNVNYYSYAGSGMASFLLKPSHVYIEFVGRTPDEKANDGLVSVQSASWTPLAGAPWPTDHLGEVGYDLSSPTLVSAFDHIAAYRRLLARAGAG